MIHTIADDLFAYLMRGVSGARFESFAKLLFAQVFGEKFVPLGGIHDGGADGALSSYIQEVQGKIGTFVQFTTTADGAAKGKVIQTIEALRKAGREPKQLIYATSTSLPKSDVIAQDVYDTESVMVQFRDFERIKNYVNADQKNSRIFKEFFHGEITSLTKASHLEVAAINEFASDPTVYVFLNYELQVKSKKNHLNEKVLDALIFWSLRDSDPDKKILVDRKTIHKTIGELFQQASSILLPQINDRLSALIKRDGSGLERLRYYKSSDCFCLPFEMRTTLASEASTVVLLQEKFRQSMGDRIKNGESVEISASALNICIELVFLTVHRYFVDQGVLLAAFLEKRLDSIRISDQVVEDIMVSALAELNNPKSLSPSLFGASLNALRGLFYHPSDLERKYLSYLSRTSCLLVTMQTAPRLLEYFNRMGGNFRLLVGTDMLIKAISERYIDEDNKQVARILYMCKRLGSELILAEPVLDEVFTHLHATDLEFRNHFSEQEKYIPNDITIDSDRIMIRAYFHSRRQANGPRSWQNFIDQLVTPEALRKKSETARAELKGALIQKFSMRFISREELESSVDRSKVEKLAMELDEAREIKHKDLSYNDALMAYATYSQRRKNNESAIYDGFGFRTWWLTKETHVLSLSRDLIASENNTPYIMRPEFILNFISISPKAADLRAMYANLLPTTAGLQLGKHLSADVMHNLLGDAAAWADTPPERISTKIISTANKLKHDQYKQYLDNV